MASLAEIEAKKRYELKHSGVDLEGLPKGTTEDRALYRYHMKEEAPIVSAEEAARARYLKNHAPQLSQQYTDTILSPELSNDNFFKAYYKWLHTPTEKAKGFWDWLTRVVPKSISGTAVAMAEFPYAAIKSFTDPIMDAFKKSIESEPQTLEEYRKNADEIGWDTTKKLGKEAFNLVEGMARFFGEPIGLYGFEKAKDKWLTDPAGGVAAVVPLIKGAGAAVAEKPMLTPVEIGEAKGIQKAYDWIDIQAPFNRAGTPETGIAFKQFPSIRNAEQQRAIITAKKIKKTNMNPGEGLDLTLETANSQVPHKVTPEIKKAAAIQKQYYKDAFKRTKADGILQTEWPKSQIDRNIKRIDELSEQNSKFQTKIEKELKKAKEKIIKEGAETIIERTIPDKAKIKNFQQKISNNLTDIKDARETIRLLKTLKPQYTHIPLNSFYEKIKAAMGEEAGTTEFNKAVSGYAQGRFFKTRKTIDVGEFINRLRELKDPQGNPIFEDADFDARMIMAQYANKLGRMRGLANIFNKAYKEGLIIDREGVPPKGFGDAPFQLTISFPELKNKYIHNAFGEKLADYTSRNTWGNVDRGAELGRIMGYTKMMAFWNALILPMYDVWQSSWAMGPRLLLPKYWKRGIKSFIQKDVEYWKAAEGATFSTPFTPPFENFKREMQATIEGKFLDKALAKISERVKNPLRLIDDVYRTNWNIAWGGDNAIRMVTYHYFKEQGMTSLEASQMTAYMHGDYARLTPRARKILNKILFTPSFKYTMGHLQANMVKSSIRVIDDALKIKMPAKRDLYLAKGLAALAVGLMFKNYIMKRYGFQTDALGLRYTKEVETDDGTKELVLYWADPNNTLLRQAFKWTRWGDEPDRLEEAMRKASWDLHPLWQLGVMLLKNQDREAEPIWNPFDNRDKIAFDIIHYSISSIVAVVGAVENLSATKGKKAAYNALRNDVGKLHSTFLSAANLAYLRTTKDERKMRQVGKLERIFKKYLAEDEPETDEIAQTRMTNFFNRLNEILEEK